jgi:hypothetical protein
MSHRTSTVKHHILAYPLNIFGSVFDGIAPPHLYGEMVKTDLGCQVLHDKGHFSDFTHFIRQHGYDSDDSDIILKLKSVLWAVVSPYSGCRSTG